jgi:tripartite-type tricarboxylate transporter receptor subunit TctC
MTDMMRELRAEELDNVSGGDGAVGASLGAAIAGAAAALGPGRHHCFAIWQRDSSYKSNDFQPICKNFYAPKLLRVPLDIMYVSFWDPQSGLINLIC